MQINAKLVAQLREQTGAGMMDCKQALSQSNGNLDQAVDYLRKKGLQASSKKAGRIASEGIVYSYIHAGGKIGVLVEINCETDFVARTEHFQQFARDIAMHIAAANPSYLHRDEIPASIITKERDILAAQVSDEGKPPAVVEKIVEGRLLKFFKESCLLDQPFVRETSKTVEQMIAETTAKIGERIVIRRFTRYVLGEGLAKRSEDFAAEVAKLTHQG